MKLFIKNKMFSLGGNSEVKNEKGEPVFKVKGKVFSFTAEKKIYDMQDNLLYIINNKFWTFFCHKVFIKNANKEKIATIKKSKWSINGNYEILDTADAMAVEGKIFSLHSTLTRNGNVIASIDRQIDWTDSFTLDAEEQDLPLCTAIVIAIDNLKDQRRNERR